MSAKLFAILVVTILGFVTIITACFIGVGEYTLALKVAGIGGGPVVATVIFVVLFGDWVRVR